MSLRLTISLIVICLIFIAYVYKYLKKNRISYKNAFLWFLLILAMGISIFSLDLLRVFADFLGIEEISNLIFLIGFVVLLLICIYLTTVVSILKDRITGLTQNMGILDKRIRDLEDENNKK